MPENLNLDSFLFGGDYSPEQWSPDVWDKDIELMQLLGVNAVTLNVHSWIFDEPSEGVFDFSWLDDIITKLKKAGIGIIMATGTTAPPSWLYNKDENILKTDIKGRKLKYGVRERFCPTSETYIYAIKKLVSKLAEHYAAEKSILLWHLNNELSGFCYCEHCEKEFRKWLKAKYGDIETLNRRWCTAMWGRCYTSFDDIVAPTELNELYVNVNGEGFDLDSLPTEAIEYARFMSDCCENLFTVESECIKKYIPNAVCTNNYQFRDRFNYHTIAKALDVISLDIYPNRNDPPYESCFNLDIARNFLDGSICLMPSYEKLCAVCASTHSTTFDITSIWNSSTLLTFFRSPVRNPGSLSGKKYFETCDTRGLSATFDKASTASASVYGLMLSNLDKSTIFFHVVPPRLSGRKIVMNSHWGMFTITNIAQIFKKPFIISGLFRIRVPHQPSCRNSSELSP